MASLQLLLPLTAYKNLVAICDQNAPEREYLANGFIETDSKGEKRVRVLCDKERAARIYGFIRRVRPELLIFITQIMFLD